MFKRRKPTPETSAAFAAVDRLKAAEAEQKTAIQRLLRALDEIPLDGALDEIGQDIGGRHDD